MVGWEMITLHLALHVLVPLAIAVACFRPRWQRAFGILMLGMVVDLDHLLATPIFDATRCSIGFHPLHQWPAMLLYGLMLVHPKSRLLGIGLCVHMVLDAIDCL